ncbi:hypothetical protein JTE90_028282 [Oedothorax gibbosus]|uniref:BTB domain-containing protein n=1 Tax=Oedothorax gibbosus TaxID=931172 RepID=A0AAV6UC34_9ARAC|nr:hypothetical protein JTE90_028282 [Oedothorax gibbosus]
MENGLDYLEIHRSPSTAGKVNLKINLIHHFEEEDILKNDRVTFESCVEDGQEKVYVIIGGWPLNFDDTEGDRIKGDIALYSESKKDSVLSIRKPLLERAPLHLYYLSEDYLSILNNTDSFADVTLKCGSIEIPVHRNILSARSNVFAAMFKSKMTESQGVVDIVDIKAKVLKYVLKYIYSGKIDPMTDALTGDLLFAADKYQLHELKHACVSHLILNTTLDNVPRMLVLGYLHDESLKEYAMEFVCKSKPRTFFKFKKTEEWKVLEREYPRLAIEVLNSALEYKHKR